MIVCALNCNANTEEVACFEVLSRVAPVRLQCFAMVGKIACFTYANVACKFDGLIIKRPLSCE